MHNRHPIPHIWLMTDPRGGDPVAILGSIRTRIGVIVRHYEWTAHQRRDLFRRIRRRAGGKHLIVVAASPNTAKVWGAEGAHDRTARRSKGLRTMAVHSLREAALARRMSADLIFVSPVFPTRSHPGTRALGPMRAAGLAGSLKPKTILLGGMDAKRFLRIGASRFYGWAAIDAFVI